MLKVICIDASNIPPCNTCGSIEELNEGHLYNSIGNFEDSYILEEKPNCVCGRSHSFYKKRFVPTSTIDEMELLEQRQEQFV
jgi:hypothetical protein